VGRGKEYAIFCSAFRHACDDSTSDVESETNFHYGKSKYFEKKDEEAVWSATTSEKRVNDTFRSVNVSFTSKERKGLLLRAFGSWHKPSENIGRDNT
jgi:hypothetical protein